MKEVVKIPSMTIEWSDWVTWDKLKIDARTGEGVRVPNESGVYEVRYRDVEKRLTIGRTKSLRRRIKRGLIKDKGKHSAGKKILASEDTSRILVRGAVTDRPAAVEEELHKRYYKKFSELPKYTEFT